jgi:hypothetical protein
MKVKGLELEYNKLAFYMIHLRFLKFTAETPNPKLRINRLMGKAINKIVSVSEEDGFNRIKYVEDFRNAESKELIAKNTAILKKREESDDEEEMEPVPEPDDKTQRRKLTAKKTIRKETFMENMFRNFTGRF